MYIFPGLGNCLFCLHHLLLGPPILLRDCNYLGIVSGSIWVLQFLGILVNGCTFSSCLFSSFLIWLKRVQQFSNLKNLIFDMSSCMRSCILDAQVFGPYNNVGISNFIAIAFSVFLLGVLLTAKAYSNISLKNWKSLVKNLYLRLVYFS